MILIGIQARSASTRLPNKIYEKLGKTTVLESLYNTALKVYPKKCKVVVLGHVSDVELESFCVDKKINFKLIDCEINDLLARYKLLRLSVLYKKYDGLIRLTSDCPLVPKEWIERIVNDIIVGVDYSTNTSPRTVIDGFDVQGISKKAFDWYCKKVKKEEHLFQILENNMTLQKQFLEKFTIRSHLESGKTILNPFHPDNKLSIDTKEDLERVRKVYDSMAK